MAKVSIAPTPWVVDSENPVIVRDADDSMVADCDAFVYTDEGEVQLDYCPANARLIAAAPDLLEVAKAMIPANLCTTNPNIRDDLVVPLEVTMGELRRIAAVIAMAEGRP
jgi:hypothetical protein